MARLPDLTAIGAIPSARSGRSIASFDTTAIGRGQQALGQAMESGAAAIGAANQNLASAGFKAAGVLANYAEDEQKKADALNVANANANLSVNATKLDAALADSTDPDEIAKHKDAYQAAVDNAATSISDPRQQELFKLKHQVTIAQAEVAAKNRTFAVQKDVAGAASVKGLYDLQQAVALEPDEAKKNRKILEAQDIIKGLEDNQYISAKTAQEMRQQWATETSVKAIQAKPPAEQINMLREAPKTREAYLDRVGGVENATGNPAERSSTSSAMGNFQFIDGTWARLIASYRPDIAKGRTAEQLAADKTVLDLRADPKLSREMAGRLTDENTKALSDAGIQATSSNLYLAHFLGAGDAIKVLKAPPGTPVADVVNPKSIAANQSVLSGKTTDTVVGWAANKMGGVARGAGSSIDFIPEDKRVAMLQHAQAAYLKQTSEDDAASALTRYNLGQGMADDLARVRSGADPKVNPDDVKLVLGSGKAQEFQDNRADAHSAYVATQDMPTMSDAQLGDRLRSLTPDPNSPGYSRQQALYAEAVKSAAAVRKERAADPASFGINRLPVVQAAAQKMVAADQGQDVAAKVAARTEFVTAQLAEQTRLGIAPDEQKILPQSYIETFQGKLKNPPANGGSDYIANQIQQEAALWGDKWPLVYKQLSKEMEGPAVVIGSGIKPQAAQTLAQLASVKYADIVKDEDTEKSSAIKKETLDAFKPLAESMVGNEGSVKTFNQFLEQGQKLAAYYVTRGSTASAAAAKAYDDLIGHKYEFRDGYRVPKSLPYPADDIVTGAAIAKSELPKMDILPETDNFGGLSKEYLRDQTLRAYQRDGKWVNDPNERGLMLIYNDHAVRKRDGSAVIIPWDELGTRGKALNATKTGPFDGAVLP